MHSDRMSNSHNEHLGCTAEKIICEPLFPSSQQILCRNNKGSCKKPASHSVYCSRCETIQYCSVKHKLADVDRHALNDCKTLSNLDAMKEYESYASWLETSASKDYDLLASFMMVWPSLTVQWLPQSQEVGEGRWMGNLLLGTQTTGDNNHLIVSEVDFGVHTGDEEVEHEWTFRIRQRINHKREVNKARFMPHDSQIVATKSSYGDVYLFKCDEFPELPTDSTFSPTLKLKGHSQSGFGLDWNSNEQGYLVSGSEDNLVCLWDINCVPQKGREIQPLMIFRENQCPVWDVAWSPQFKNILASVGSQKEIYIHDTRHQKNSLTVSRAHKDDINSVAFSCHSDYQFATASSDKTISIWDLRNVNVSIDSLESHTNEVLQVEWSPVEDGVLASTDKVNQLFLWDIKYRNRNGSTSHTTDSIEPFFQHRGHVLSVNDLSWSATENIIASVSQDNLLQLWRLPKDDIIQKGINCPLPIPEGTHYQLESDRFENTLTWKSSVLEPSSVTEELEDGNEAFCSEEDDIEDTIQKDPLQIREACSELEKLQQMEEALNLKTQRVEVLQGRCRELEMVIVEKDREILELKCERDNFKTALEGVNPLGPGSLECFPPAASCSAPLPLSPAVNQSLPSNIDEMQDKISKLEAGLNSYKARRQRYLTKRTERNKLAKEILGRKSAQVDKSVGN